MNLDDARVVLEWMGMRVAVINGELRWDTTDCDHSLEEEYYGEDMLDANWIMGTLVPALKTKFPQKWGINVFYGWDDAVSVYFFGVGVETLKGTGSTFEAAMISAAAKAIRGTK